ncbi:MAG: FAD-binding oxidoreductase [Candidatus Saccharimonadales bacterium]
MNKVAHYLQEHLEGEVMTSPDARRYFATDGSILQVLPEVVVYPRSESDVRKTARFSWQLAERGRVIPITARGAGTDQSGAALGSGIVLAFLAHMHRVLEYDGKSGVVVVEPGANYGKLQQTLITHGRFLPPFPASLEYSSIGGAVANNAAGEKSVKYGATNEYVRSLRVVLANGEVIETGPLNKRELNKKLGLTTFEGEIYRAVDALLEEQKIPISKSTINVTKNAAGYNIADVRQRDGSFDLTPLFVGAQGTLGVITEIVLDSELHNTAATLFAVRFDSIANMTQAVERLRKLPSIPSSIEMVDDNLLKLVDELNTNQLKGVVNKPFPRMILLVEFDDINERTQKRSAKKAEKIFHDLATDYKMELDKKRQELIWRIRDMSAVVSSHVSDKARALPVIEDGIVPLDKFEEYLQGMYDLFARNKLRPAVWGHAGDGNVHIQPFLDLAQVGDRQKLFRLMTEYYELVLKLGGSTSAQHNDGRLRAPFLKQLYGDEQYEVFRKIKKIFDPHGILNPGVKVDVSLEDIKPLLRSEYSLHHLYDHMPRS